VVLAGGRPQLVEVKAVGPGYPLRGVLRTADHLPGQAGSRGRPAAGPPERGTLWVAPRLLPLLGLQMGQSLGLGQGSFTVARVVTDEPDSGGELFSAGPRVLMNLADVPGTGLVQPGSRVTHRLLVAGPAAGVQRFHGWLRGRLAPGEQVVGVHDARPRLRAALDRGQQFLGLAALVSVLLAGVAVATAARRYAERHLDASAVMRCLGGTQSLIARLYGLEMLWVALIASAVGCAVGFAAQAGLAALLAGLFLEHLPAPGWQPLAVGMATGLIVLLGFALPPLLVLRRVPPARVLRRELGPMPTAGWLVYAAVVVAMGALMAWEVQDPWLLGYLAGGCVLMFALLAAGASLLVRGLGALRGRVGVAWRFGLTAIARRRRASTVQIVALGTGIMVLLVLSVVRSDLLADWRASVPPDAPNHFLVNIQPDQVQPLRRFFVDHGLPEPGLYPMVRGRLVAVNGRAVKPGDYPPGRARRLVEREFNLSWARRLHPGNRIVAGRWWGPQTHGQPMLSLEQGIADTLGIGVGDRLTYQVAGRRVTVTVTSVRAVEWDSFRVNFFAVVPPGVLDDYPATWVTSFHLPAERAAFIGALVARFPNVTDVDVEAVLTRVRRVIERVMLAVQYVFGFSVLAGLMVLYAAIEASQDARRREHAVMRVLGARRAQLRRGLLAEFVSLGALAGVLAGAGATALGWVLARQVFHLAYQPDPWVLVLGGVAGALGVGVAGLAGTRSVLRHPPLRTLQRG